MTKRGDSATDRKAETAGFGAVVAPTLDAVVAPGRCFDALDEAPVRAWWIWLWASIGMLALGVWNLPLTRRLFAARTRAHVESSGQEMSAEQLRRAQQMNESIGTITTFAAPLFLLIQLLIIAAIIWLLAALLGRSGGFSRAFAVAAGAAVVPPLLYSAYTSVLLHLGPPQVRRLPDVASMQPSAGLDLLFDRAELASWLVPILQRVDLFNAWRAVLVVIGGEKMLGLGRRQAIAVAVVLWVLTTTMASLGGLAQGLVG